MRITMLLAALVCFLMSPAQAASSGDGQTIARIETLLRVYSEKDIPAFMRMLDPGAAMYGTAASEFYTTPTGIEGLLRADYRQWTSSSFGEPRNVTVETSGALQAVFFDAPFTAKFQDGNSRTFMLRFATVWRKSETHWRLVQSTNAVATP